jgi:hypothetical protein
LIAQASLPVPFSIRFYSRIVGSKVSKKEQLITRSVASMQLQIDMKDCYYMNKQSG